MTFLAYHCMVSSVVFKNFVVKQTTVKSTGVLKMIDHMSAQDPSKYLKRRVVVLYTTDAGQSRSYEIKIQGVAFNK